jgi:UPF0755 protein
MIRKIFLALTSLVLLLIIAAVIGALEARKMLMPVSQTEQQILVTIPKGATAGDIGLLLEKEGVIQSAEAFRYLAMYKKVGPQLKAGEHVLDPSLDTIQILDSLVQGRFKLYRLTVPEGLTMKEIAPLVSQAGFGDPQEFLAACHDREFIASLGLEVDNLEGYLFPETYHFIRGATPRDVVKTMVGHFLEVWARYQDEAAKKEVTRQQVVTLASIVEKETGAPAERPLIAGVFLNRLKKGMRLETDPTVIYGLKDFDGNLTRKHLETPTPYNTYQIDGLPPGPIANPGEDSIKAVLEPTESNYLFFVSKNDGTHQFSATLAEHNRAVAQYQKKGQAQKKADPAPAQEPADAVN